MEKFNKVTIKNIMSLLIFWLVQNLPKSRFGIWQTKPFSSFEVSISFTSWIELVLKKS